MTTQAAPQPKSKKVDILAYNGLKNLCPDLPKLREGEFVILKSKVISAPDVTIGCRYPEKENFSGIYEIYSTHDNTKVYTTIEVSHKNKTAAALLYETNRAGEKEITEAKNIVSAKFQSLLNDLKNKGYKQPNAVSQPTPSF